MKIERYEDNEVYLRTSEGEDVIASLELCHDCLHQLMEKPTYWKWLILSLHNAVQGTMVCHLSGTAQLGALEKKHAHHWLDFLTRPRCDQPTPKERLADFMELLSRLLSPTNQLEAAGPVICVTDSQKRSLKKLNQLRREFTHFTPKGWSIELSGMPAIIEDAVSIMEAAAAAPWAFRHLDENDAKRLADLLSEIKRTSKQALSGSV